MLNCIRKNVKVIPKNIRNDGKCPYCDTKNYLDINNSKTILPPTQPIRNGGRIYSRNNRKRNRITKYKKNRSKKYYHTFTPLKI